MTFQNVRLKIASPALKLKTAIRLAATIVGRNFIEVSQNGTAFTVKADYTLLDPSPIIDPSATLVAIWDADSQTFKTASISSLIAQAGAIDQHITAAGPVAVLNNAGIVRVDQAVGAAITLNMPLSSAKTCPVLISDWKGDAGTNNITINLAGADKFPGGLTSWTIAADTGSIRLSPIAGAGYTIG
jgi:hypothetical protein